MLQWMGGSRRKVNNSRNSVQKRQKQYFEQRRQLQHLQASGLDIHDEQHKDNGNVQKEQCRSLDIISLLNLSKVAQQCRSTCPNGGKSSAKDSLKHPESTICRDTVLSTNSTEYKEAVTVESGSLSPNKVNTVSPKNHRTGLSFEAIDGHKNASNIIGAKKSHWKSTDQELSIIDLLGEDGWDGDLEVKRKNEDHVSFSVQGLGNVGRVTPVHSPRQLGKHYSYGCSSPLKVVPKLQSSKNFNFINDLEMDAMMQDRDIPSGGNAYQVPFYRNSPVNTLNNGLLTFDDCMQLDEDNSNTKASFGNRDTFYDNIWNARPNIRDCDYFEEKGHDYNFFEERRHDYNFFEEKKHDYDFFEENRHDYDFFEEKSHNTRRAWQKDHDPIDTYRFGNKRPDFTFAGSRPPEKRKTKMETKRFISEPPSPYYRHQDPELDDFVISDFLGYNEADKDFSFRDMASHPNRDHFSTDGPRNSLSEEACSSSAVRGKIEKILSMGKQSTRECGKNMSSTKVLGKRREIAKTLTNMSNPSRSKAARHNYISAEDKLKGGNSWLEEEWQLPESNVQSLDVNFWDEDPFRAFNVSKTESSFRRSKYDVPSDFSQSSRGRRIPEKLVFCSPSRRVKSYDTLDTVFEETKRELSEDTKKQRGTSDSSVPAGSDGDSVNPDFINQELVTGMENMEKTPSAVDARSQSEKELSASSHLASSNTALGHQKDFEVLSETGQNIHTSDSGSKWGKSKSETPEATEKNTRLTEGEIAENSESDINTQVIHNEGSTEVETDDVDN